MAQYGAFSVFQRVTADALNALIPDVYYKSGSTSRASTTTVVDDPDLIVPVQANELCLIEFYVKYSGGTTGTAPGTGPGIRTHWGVPSGTTTNRQVTGPGSGATDSAANNISGHWGVHGTATDEDYGWRSTTGSSLWLYEWAVVQVGSTAGNISFQWAQTTSGTSPVLVTGGSFARHTRYA